MLFKWFAIFSYLNNNKNFNIVILLLLVYEYNIKFCYLNNIWNNDLLLVNTVDCADPYILLNTTNLQYTITPNASLFPVNPGTTIAVQCAIGYMSNGSNPSSVITCGINGIWNFPTCSGMISSSMYCIHTV